jgi:predicted GH43/DUF377 family glycosyl hydrolase
MKPHFRYSPRPVLEPVPGCEWASRMVLNPAIIKDPSSDTLHMLFRATAPWSKRRKEGKYDPYPIFLGYARSDDLGKTWEADFSRPALAPALNERFDDIYITDIHGNRVRDYSNGCIEDPRLFPVEGGLYLSAACRMFPPGPYWLIDQEPSIDTRNDYVPEWAHESDDAFSITARTNNTVTVLYKVNLEKLKAGRYEEAFQYVCPLTEGHVSDNRDAFLFPEKMRIDGRMQYVMLHRPLKPSAFPQGDLAGKPSIYLAAADNLEDLATDRATHRLLATSLFHWEDDRIGASWPPLKISEREWLVSYHGKKDARFGYTQSFMIVCEQDDDFPKVTHRCSERLMYAQQDWEMPGDYPTPCLFTTGGIVVGDDLIMSYGAADKRAGIAWVNFAELVEYVKQFDAEGRKAKA